jgi:hypothetical protein
MDQRWRTDIPDQPQWEELPDRQEYNFDSSQEYVPSSLQMPLTQQSQQSKQGAADSQQSVSATPSQDGYDNLRSTIKKMNEEFRKYGYEAFVHNNTHFIFKTYHGIDLNMPKWWEQ